MAAPAVPTRVPVAPDNFKGTFRAPEVAAAMSSASTGPTPFARSSRSRLR